MIDLDTDWTRGTFAAVFAAAAFLGGYGDAEAQPGASHLISLIEQGAEPDDYKLPLKALKAHVSRVSFDGGAGGMTGGFYFEGPREAPRPPYRIALEPGDPVMQASCLLHESYHVYRTVEREGGLNTYSNERDAWDLQQRFLAGYHIRHPAAFPLTKSTRDWLCDRAGYLDFIVEAYAKDGRIPRGEETLEKHWSTVYRLVNWGLGSASARAELSRLERDREMHWAADARNAQWRVAHRGFVDRTCAGYASPFPQTR